MNLIEQSQDHLDLLYAAMMQHSREGLVNKLGDIEKVTQPVWCVHFSYDALDIARNGFTKGSPLGTNWHATNGMNFNDAGYNFAVNANDENAINFWGSHSHEAVVFKATGVQSFHYDDFNQMTFWHGDVIRPIYSIECVAESFMIAEEQDYRLTSINGSPPTQEIVMPLFDMLTWIETSPK